MPALRRGPDQGATPELELDSEEGVVAEAERMVRENDLFERLAIADARRRAQANAKNGRGWLNQRNHHRSAVSNGLSAKRRSSARAKICLLAGRRVESYSA